MFVLIGEEEGDYDDFYQRPMEVLAVSNSKDLLEKYWVKVLAEEECSFIEHGIYEVPYLKE